MERREKDEDRREEKERSEEKIEKFVGTEGDNRR